MYLMCSFRFENYFRINKDCFQDVLKEISPKLKSGRRSLALRPEIKLATALRFLAQGSYQTSVGNDFNISITQPTVSVVLKEVLEACEATICCKWIMTEEEKNSAKEYFFTNSGIPGVIGCVDGTHIKIISPGRNDANMCFNRKGFYSLNAMVVCDHKMKIRYFDARYGGSAHDSLVWNVSVMKRLLQERYDAGERNSWLLGDAGYPFEPFLMKAISTANMQRQETLLKEQLDCLKHAFGAYRLGTISNESNFNSKHAKARNIAERTIGLLKTRFRCLLGARELHYSPIKAAVIANVCVALHNKCMDFAEEHLDDIENIIMQERNYQEDVEGAYSTEASQIRNNIRDNLF
ncbi:putative nuclease HARBI1 [Musca domestica]|uniref:Nuclease HARBI1 n=1 Tax=Musca domestica TaxID=7370 RepID=A0ABM3VEN0_MUSDO|nr:putative nuclease HARBI1 [Musca domestica]